MKISLILPCYNEEVNLQKGVLDKVGNFVKEKPNFLEVLIVDDGSDDDSRKIIKEKYLPQFKKFKLIEEKHGGKAKAIITGIESAKGDYVLFSDFDLATPIEEADKLIDGAKNGFDIVIGSRNIERKGAPILRKIMALGAIILRNIFIGLSGIKDTQCGFKLFKREIALDVLKRLRVYHNRKKVSGSSVSSGFDIEFLFLAEKLGYKIKEVPVTWRHVETKNVNFIKDSLEGLKDILKIKYDTLTGKYNFKK